MAAAVNPSWVSGHYRFENDDGTLDTSTFIANEDTTITQSANENFRLRINWGESAGQTKGNALNPALQFRINAGAWTTVGSATAIKFISSGTVTDATKNTTQRIVTAPTGVATYVDTEFDSNNVATTNAPSDQYYEISFNLYLDSGQLTNNDVIDYQLIDANATYTFGTIDTVPSLTASVASSGVTGTGSLTAQSSTMSGAGIVHKTGTGSLTAQSSTISGAGTVGNAITGTGALVSQPATISGVAVIHKTGTGVLTAQSATITGTGVVGNAVVGTGSLFAQSSVITGNAEIEKTGTGSLFAQSSTISGVGVIGRTSVGVLLAQAATMSGSGVVGDIEIETVIWAAQQTRILGSISIVRHPFMSRKY